MPTNLSSIFRFPKYPHLGVLYKAENWHALSLEQYFSKYHFLDICQCTFKNYKLNSRTLAELFNMCMKESCFPDCWKVSLVFYVFKNAVEKSTAKNYHPVCLLSVVSKVFEKLVNNRLVDHPQKCNLFSDFQYGFRSSQSTTDLLTVVPDRIVRAFNRSVWGYLSCSTSYIHGF